MRRLSLRLFCAAALVCLAGAAAAAPGPAATPPVARERGRLDFVLVPAGSYQMGSPSTEWGSKTDEQAHPVTITRPFFLATYEVTQAQWIAATGSNPSFLYDCPECPVENITWYEAVAFCNILSHQLGLPPAYTIRDTLVAWNRDSDGIRLPTEGEWEYAARAGTTTVFYSGDCLSTDLENYLGYDPQKGCPKGLWRGQAIEVGSLPPNPWQLYDVLGNVSEWVWDWYSYHPAGHEVDPTGADGGYERVIRGGNWHDLGRNCRSACRQKAAPNQLFSHVGLRLARSVPKQDLHP
jgi:formylglycine-generating enzyme